MLQLLRLPLRLRLQHLPLLRAAAAAAAGSAGAAAGAAATDAVGTGRTAAGQLPEHNPTVSGPGLDCALRSLGSRRCGRRQGRKRHQAPVPCQLVLQHLPPHTHTAKAAWCNEGDERPGWAFLGHSRQQKGEIGCWEQLAGCVENGLFGVAKCAEVAPLYPSSGRGPKLQTTGLVSTASLGATINAVPSSALLRSKYKGPAAGAGGDRCRISAPI
jgi:hypothetical protein